MRPPPSGRLWIALALAAGAFKPGVVLTVLGTWDIIVAAIGEPILTPEVCQMGAWVDSHVARDTWAVMGSAVAGDSCSSCSRSPGSVNSAIAVASVSISVRSIPCNRELTNGNAKAKTTQSIIAIRPAHPTLSHRQVRPVLLPDVSAG